MGREADKRIARDILEVSRAYRRLGSAVPPPELDARIALHARAVLPQPGRSLQASRGPVSSRRRWFGQLALAAGVLLLVLSLALLNFRSTPRTTESPVRLIRAVATREDHAQLRYPAPPAFAAKPPREGSPYVAPLIPTRRLYSTDPPGSHSAATPAPALPSAPESVVRRDPQQWQAYIEQLDREGRAREAAIERRDFRQVYPDFN